MEDGKWHIVSPKGMRSIPDGYYEGNSDVRTIHILGHVKEIGSRAFANCEKLEEVIIDEGVERLGDSLFEGSHMIKRVVIPDSVRVWGATFAGAQFNAPVLNPTGTRLYHSPASPKEECYKIPEGVKKIEGFAFKGRRYTNVILPDSLEIIGHMAFLETDIIEITIPEGVREVRESAFYNCPRLKRVTICGRGTYITKKAFSGCSLLNEI